MHVVSQIDVIIIRQDLQVVPKIVSISILWDIHGQESNYVKVWNLKFHWIHSNTFMNLDNLKKYL